MGLQYIDSLSVDFPGAGTRTLQLCMGDVSNMSPQDHVDFLIVSSFPGDYAPTPGSVIGALNQQGVSVQALSQNKAANYEPVMPCWISQPVSSVNPGIQFGRILLFEPPNPATTAQGLIPDIFRGLSCFNGTGAATAAIPMVCTGSGGANMAYIFYSLFYGSTFGQSSYTFPLTTVKLVVYNQVQLNQVQPLFTQFKNNYTNILSLNLPGGYSNYASNCWAWAQSAQLPPYISKREAFGVRLYTSNYYSEINAVLRGANPNDPTYMTMMPVFDAINAGLANLPDSAGMTYRGEFGMTPDRINQWTPGNNVVNLAYTSTARPAGSWYNGAPYKFNINGLTCKSISPYSEFPSENEFLYAPDLIQNVTSRTCSNGNAGCTFGANEVVPNWCNK
jgi:hypothetical protein